MNEELSLIYSDALLVEEARNRYFATNGFSVDGYTAPTYTIRLLGITLKFPNTESHQRAVPLHDLHHILTGYRTDWLGEAEIGAWELRAGCNSFITYFLNRRFHRTIPLSAPSLASFSRGPRPAHPI